MVVMQNERSASDAEMFPAGFKQLGLGKTVGVPPDVFVDNTPSDFLKGRDAQIEKAVELLKEQLAKPRTSTQQ